MSNGFFMSEEQLCNKLFAPRGDDPTPTMYDSTQMETDRLVEGDWMEEAHQSDEDLTDSEIIERWMNYGRKLHTALEEADYDQVTALVANRARLLDRLERMAERLSDDQKQSLLATEADLQESMQQHHEYMKKKLSGLGRMKLGVRKYTGR